MYVFRNLVRRGALREASWRRDEPKEGPENGLFSFRWPAPGEIPGLGRCGARGRASQARTRAASGAPPGGTTAPCQELADGRRAWAKTQPPAVGKRGPAPEGKRRGGAPKGAPASVIGR